jgi:hypothetical protein
VSAPLYMCELTAYDKIYNKALRPFIASMQFIDSLHTVSPSRARAFLSFIIMLGCLRESISPRMIDIPTDRSGYAYIRQLAGAIVGQAACFDEYELEDGTVVKVGARAASEVTAPSDADLEAAEAAVKQQGEKVRALKQVEGRGNDDLQVQVCSPECNVCLGRPACNCAQRSSICALPVYP